MSVVELFTGLACETPLVIATPAPAARTTAMTPVRRRARAKDMVLLGVLS
jgi:hypothetical protein